MSPKTMKAPKLHKHTDTVCHCGHWFEEHGPEGCECGCERFTFDAKANTPGAIADRGGEHNEATCRCALCRWLRAKNGGAS